MKVYKYINYAGLSVLYRFNGVYELNQCWQNTVYKFRSHLLYFPSPSAIPVLTFTGTTLTYEPHHEGSALVALGGRVE